MSTTPNQTDPWLRGPIEGIPAPLLPIAQAFIAASEDIEGAMAATSPDEVSARPGGVASLGFHLAHLAGSTDRLLTYARGESLSPSQRDALLRERAIADARPSAEELVEAVKEAFRRGLSQLAGTDEATLSHPRAVGRAQSPSTVLGLLFHAAEHAARHTGQIVTTAKLTRGLSDTLTP